MTTVLCTLYNSLYLDKGLVLYDSLCRCSKDFKLYVLCMDDKCYEVLTDLKQVHHIPIRLQDFESANKELISVKPSRTLGEYFWTCGSLFLKYVIEKFNPDYCTYIDADMAFYDDPQCIIDEMIRRNASVSIVGHRFSHHAKEQEWKVGKYCVECNTFKNDKNGIELLNIWANQCLDYCSIDGDGIHWADQKYMDNWVDDYPYVIELENLGAGVAPWNISQYKLKSYNDSHITLQCKDRSWPLLFYHFEGITYLSENKADLHVFKYWGIQEKLVYSLYDPYLSEIAYYKKILRDKYGISAIIKHHPGVAQKGKSPFWIRIKHVLSAIFQFKLNKYISFYNIINGKKNIRVIKVKESYDS